MKTEELRALFAKLPETERLALDDTIMDRGVTDFDELMKTMELVTTYFKEQPESKDVQLLEPEPYYVGKELTYRF